MTTVERFQQIFYRGIFVSVIFPDSGVTVNQLKEFLEEATLMKDLKHKNIVNLLGVVIENNKPYVVLPFMEKGDLKSYVSDGNNVRKFHFFCQVFPVLCNKINIS